MSEDHGPKEIWETLTAVDVSKWVEPRAGLDYLAWGAAWILLQSKYPQARYWYHHHDNGGVYYFNDGSAEVHCFVEINLHTRSCHLPVMDYRHNAIINPDARAINDCKQRALVKTCAMWGLGINLYQKNFDDVPAETSEVTKPKSSATKTTKKKSPKKSGKDGPKGNGKVPENKVAMTLDVFASGAKNLEELRDLYRSNKEVIKKMEKEDPEAHKITMQAFSNRKKELQQLPDAQA